MKLRYLYENTANILRRLKESDGVTKWRFVANPNCCDKCQEMDGEIVESNAMPVWYGHAPGEPGRFNCRCHWEPVEDTEELDGEENYEEY